MKKIMPPIDKKKLTKKLTGAGIIALAIIIVIFLNASLSILADRYNLYSDMTEEGLYTISDELTDLLDGTDIADSIEIIFCCAEDYAKNNYTNLENGEALSYVHSTATQIADRYDNVRVTYRDVQKEPDFFKDNFQDIERFLMGIEDPIIVAKKNADGKYGTHFKVYAARAFYGFASTDGSLYAYNGEAVFASAILSLSLIEAPTVYFTVGHGETLTPVTDNTVPCELWNLFLACGFEVAQLDLGATQGKIPDNASLIIINQPQNDFSAQEVESIGFYLRNKGSVMFFSDPTMDENLKNLYGFLEANAGITVSDGLVTDPSTSLTNQEFTFTAGTADNNAAGAYLSYLKDPSSAKSFFEYTAAINIDSKFMSDEGHYMMSTYAFTLPLYQTGGSALLDGEDGEYNVVSVTSFARRYDGANGELPHDDFSYLLFAPSAGFASDEALNSNNYSNRDAILSVAHVITSAQTPANIDYKIFQNYDLVISEKQAKTTTACLVIIPTAIIVLIGAVVIFRRKHR